jgi:curli biogenesis system outer membrane secretion channel CsgG
LSSFYGNDYNKEVREKLKGFDVKAFFVGSVVGHRDTENIYVNLIDVETGRVIWSAVCERALHYWNFSFSNPAIRKITRQLESDIESHNKERKSKTK